MPGMGGAELVERAKEMRPTLKVIMTSGTWGGPHGHSLLGQTIRSLMISSGQ